MKNLVVLKWQKKIIDHCYEVEFISEEQVKILNASYSKIEDKWYDEIISKFKNDNGYFVEQFEHGTNCRVETFSLNSINQYLEQ